MADAVIGALRVELSANTAQLEDGLKRGQSALSDFARNITNIAAGIGLEKIIEKSVTAFVGFIKEGVGNAINTLDEFGKASQKIGVPVEQLSELSHAANLADVSTEQLTSSMVRFSKDVAEAERGAITPATNAFIAMGVSVKNNDGTIKSQNELLLETADKFKNYEDGANKTALAIALFGKAGAQLIPFLNQGREGIQAAGEEAHKFSIVVSEEAAANAEKFNDNLKRLGAIVEGIFIKAVSQASAELVVMSKALLDVVSSADLANTTTNFLTSVFKRVALEAVNMNQTIEQIAINFSALKEILKAQFGDWETITKIWNDSRAAIDEVNRRAEEQRAIIAGNIPFYIRLQDALRDVIALNAAIVEQFGKTAAPVLANQAAANKYAETITNLNARTSQLLGTTTGLADGFLKEAVQLKIMDANTASATTSATNLNKQQNDLNDAMLRFEGAKIIDQGRGAWEKYEIQLLKIRDAQKAFGDDAETVGKLNQRAGEMTAEIWETTAKGVLSGWDQAMQGIAKSNKSLAIAAKVTAIGMAIINTAIGITKAFAELGPFGFIAAAGIAAAGAVQIAAIASQGFARGGAFKIGGGMTGIDSEMIAFKATPGEVVDVRRPEQAQGRAQTINLQLPSPNDFFSVHVRQMVTALNKAAPDGYVLKVAR
jgi:hypothetical protein